MAFSLITSWQIGGGELEAVTDFIFLVSIITADGAWGHEMKRWLFFGRKAMTNLVSLLKRVTTLPIKVQVVKAMIFPVLIYGCESWSIKRAEDLRLLNCGAGDNSWESFYFIFFLRVILNTKWSSQSILKKINPDDSLEGLMLTQVSNMLVTWCKERTPWKRPWFWERLKPKWGRGKGWNGLRASPTQWHEFEQTMGDSGGQRSLACCNSWDHEGSDSFLEMLHVSSTLSIYPGCLVFAELLHPVLNSSVLCSHRHCLHSETFFF